MPWGSDAEDLGRLDSQLHHAGAATATIEADLADPAAPAHIFASTETYLGKVTALCAGALRIGRVRDPGHQPGEFRSPLCCECPGYVAPDSGVCPRLEAQYGLGRIIGLTSDHVAGNLPHGASKGALDRIVLAAVRELGDLGVTANVINPGATDTGWMTDAQMHEFAQRVPLGGVSTPDDCANLVSFLCSPEGGWINGQLLYSNGGVQ